MMTNINNNNNNNNNEMFHIIFHFHKINTYTIEQSVSMLLPA